MYLTGIFSGEDYKDLRPAITINILAFNVLPQAEPHAMYSIYNIKTGDRLNRDMELHFLEIPKYTHKPISKMTKMERWLAYFANQLNKQEREELAMSEAAISNAYDAASAFMMNPQDRMSYVNRQMAIMDYNSGMNAAKELGEKTGEEKMAKLVDLLSEADRYDDLKKASRDPQYRAELYKEFNL